MRRVIAICRSSKKKRLATARVLDRYLWRVGDRTWRGTASNACLERISRELKVSASRRMAVSVQEIRPAHQSYRPLFTVGSRRMFHSSGTVPVSVSTDEKHERDPAAAPGVDALPAILAVAAAFHDLGKATVMFQNKLRRALCTDPRKGARALADPVRHEAISALALDTLFERLGGTDAAFLSFCRSPEPVLVEEAMAGAREIIECEADGEIRPASYEHEFAILATAPRGVAAAILHLVVAHHRLPAHRPGEPEMLDLLALVRPGDIDSLDFDPDALDVADGAPLWRDVGWESALGRAAQRIPDDFALEPGFLPLARTAFILADHLGSSESEISAAALGELEADGPVHLANTRTDEARVYPADTLARHTERVREKTKRAARLVRADTARLPALTPDDVPAALRAPPASESPRFAWQERAARAVRDLVTDRPGGFFACIAAGTGSGKTRGAPAALAAAALGDADPGRRRLRFNLGLGLRTLASQSGRAYSEDLGFGVDDVAVRVGGVRIAHTRDGACVATDEATAEDADEVAGSEDRSSGEVDDTTLRVREVVEEGGVGREAEPAWLSALSYTPGDRELSFFLERVLACERSGAASLRALHATPVVAATLDHFMSATDARRSSHLHATLRVLSSDLIVDEIDQLGEEDLAALARLVYLVGLGGRRVIVMSATLPEDVATRMHASYCAGWAHYARETGAAATVNAVCASDAPAGIRTNADGETFAEIYAGMVTAIAAALAAAPALRKGRELAVKDTFDDTVDALAGACRDLHADHHCEIADGDASIRLSCGLIRLTRIGDVQAAAQRLGAVPGIHVEFVYLHAALPFIRRSFIESQLQSALTRKGEASDARLAAFARERGILARAGAAGARDAMVVVLSSPVIETGNDIDLDWAVIDPSSIRAVVQTAGRVNRHRALPVAAPNIAILSHSLVVAFGSGKMEKPGVETPPAPDTGLAPLALDGDRRFIGSLVPRACLDTIDARLAFARGPEYPLAEAELSVRAGFFDRPPGLASYSRDPDAQNSSTHPTARRFRREDRPLVDIMPEIDAEGRVAARWGFYAPGQRRPTWVDVDLAHESLSAGRDLFPETLPDLLSAVSSPSLARRAGYVSVGEREALAGKIAIDPALGWLRAGFP